MNPALLRGMTAIPGLASRFGGSSAGLTLRQAAPAAGALLNRGMTAAQFAGGGLLGALGTALSLGGDTAQKPQWGAIPPRDQRGESYRDAELRLGNRGGSGGNAGYSVAPTQGQQGSYSPAAERAYAATRSSVAQQAAQNPEFQRYELARQKAVSAGPGSAAEQSAEDLGMQMWRQKYGGTKMAQPGGAVGSFNPLMQATFGYQTGMAPGQVSAMQQTAAPIPVAPGEAPYFQGDLGTRATLETGYDPAAYGLTPGKIEDMKSKLLKQAAVNSASSVTK
jgi:hypothetical protein